MTLRYVFHVSDLHIRNGDIVQCRYNEYNDVFDKFFISLKNKIKQYELTFDDYVIVVSGDIFHNKNNIGNYGLVLYKKFIHNLTSIGRTIVFHGNHDKNQNEANQPSLVSSTIAIDNLILLDTTMCFAIDDVCFSYVSIDDTLDKYKTCGRIDELPQFPIIDAKHKVALFHGTFAKVSLYNGTRVGDEHRPYPFEWIKEFDFAILGDIHLRQYGNYGKTIWGYSGSLVQQNYGEDIIDHGYMIWDLFNKTIEEVNVYNPIGLVNIKQESSQLLIRKRGVYIDIHELLHNEYFPKHLEIKLYSSIDIDSLVRLQKKHGFTFDIVCRINHFYETPANTIYNISTSNEISVDKDVMLKYFHKHLTENQHNILSNIIGNYDMLLFDMEKYPDELHDDCLKKNKEISALIATCITSNDIKSRIPQFTITFMEWENLYCFSDKNYINFETTYNNTFLISGQNGTGKSSIYDIITLAIWGDITPGRQSNIPSGIINYLHENAYVKIMLENKNGKYCIHRRFNKLGNTIQKKAVIYENNIVIKKDNACSEYINKTFGTFDDFITTSMITQNVDNDILKMSYKDCLAIIDNASNLNYTYNLYTLFKGCMNKYKDFKKTIESHRKVYEKLIANNIKTLDIDHERETLAQLTSRNLAMINECNSIDVDVHDSENIIILNTEYSDVPDDITMTEEEYRKLQEDYILLYQYLNKFDQDEINIMASKYDKSMKLVPDIEKPCDLTFINEEENYLKQLVQQPIEIIETSVDLGDIVCTLRNSCDEINVKIAELNEIKPAKIMQVSFKKEDVEKIIQDLYESINTLDMYARTGKNMANIANDFNATCGITVETHLMTLKKQNEMRMMLNKLTKSIEKEKKQQDALYEKQRDLFANMVDKPYDTECVHDNSKKLAKLLSKYDIEKIHLQITECEVVLGRHKYDYDDVKLLEQKLSQIKNELQQLLDTEEYKYDPKCEFCCRRPWVSKMNELRDIISTSENEINNKKGVLRDSNYELFIEKHKTLLIEKHRHDNLVSWFNYYKFREECSCLVAKIDKKAAKINSLTEETKCIEHTLNDISVNVSKFHEQTWQLYTMYQNSIAFNEFQEWKEQYEHLCKEKERYDKEFECANQHMIYKQTVEPRLKRLNDLKNQYEKWHIATTNNNIVHSYQLIETKKYMDKYERHKEYQRCKIIKQKLARKMDLLNKISKCSDEIETKRDNISREEMTISYNISNKQKYDALDDICSNTNEIIETMDVIINKFKAYRREIYENHILKNLVIRANKYIKDVCHSDTKKFEIDYMITELRDIIHINWLINVDKDNNSIQQTIPINHASGFQRFVISLALRMSLFQDKNCTQLFFDEGFTACDKLNLSIIPRFLKGLLKMFRSVIVVSHIDIIRDNVDLISHIQYCPVAKTSRIQYD